MDDHRRRRDRPPTKTRLCASAPGNSPSSSGPSSRAACTSESGVGLFSSSASDSPSAAWRSSCARAATGSRRSRSSAARSRAAPAPAAASGSPPSASATARSASRGSDASFWLSSASAAKPCRAPRGGRGARRGSETGTRSRAAAAALSGRDRQLRDSCGPDDKRAAKNSVATSSIGRCDCGPRQRCCSWLWRVDGRAPVSALSAGRGHCALGSSARWRYADDVGRGARRHCTESASDATSVGRRVIKFRWPAARDDTFF